MTNREMYLQFRRELDRMCVTDILRCVETEYIRDKGQIVGMMCSAFNYDAWVYIDCLYIRPRYRRRGLARDTVLKWYENHKSKEIRLHIINRNQVAYAFWTSLFDLEAIEQNEVDTLYRIKGVRI